MVTTDVSQLTTECKDWLQILRNYREEFQTSKKSSFRNDKIVKKLKMIAGPG